MEESSTGALPILRRNFQRLKIVLRADAHEGDRFCLLAAAFHRGTDMRAADADVGKASVIERAQFGHGATVAEIVSNGFVKFHFHGFQ